MIRSWYKLGALIKKTVFSSEIRDFIKKYELPIFHHHRVSHTSISLQIQAGKRISDNKKRTVYTCPAFSLTTPYIHTARYDRIQ